MPDYDPKNIPTLEDIIEDDDFNAADLNSTSMDSTDPEHTNLDLTDIINVDLNTSSNTDVSGTEAEEQAQAKDNNLDLFLLDLCLDETSEQQSDLAKTFSDKNDHDINDSSTNASPVFDVAPSEKLKISLDPAELESIVESVVNKLLPDLELQLRTQLRQALDDKLNEEVSTLLNSETTQNSNTN